MENLNPEENSSLENEDLVNASPKKNKKWPWILLGLAFLIAGAGLGWWIGYQTAVQNRLDAETTQILMDAATQYELGVQDLEAGRLDVARKRFEYVVEINPTFPGIEEKLVEVMVAQANISTPTAIPSPTLTPTPDMRGEQELLDQAYAQLKNNEWTEAINTVEALRQMNISYKSVAADGIYYSALRNRGVNRILIEGSLEPGLYDLALSERFGPLDLDAQSYRTWARYYISGASFWRIDWAKVVDIFAQIYPAFPNLRDGSGLTATERFRQASIAYGDQLAIAGDYCAAQVQYENALALVPDERVSQSATEAYDHCEASKQQEQPSQPSAQPTASPTPAETQVTTPVETTPAETEIPPTETPAPTVNPNTGETPTP